MLLFNYLEEHNTVTRIARQLTGKHLATEYTHATIQLRMLLRVVKQQSAPIKSLTGNYVTGFLWSVPWPLLCNNSVNELSTMDRPFSVGSVQRGYLENHRRYKGVLGRRQSQEVRMWRRVEDCLSDSETEQARTTADKLKKLACKLCK
jgi:hypothetical protein